MTHHLDGAVIPTGIDAPLAPLRRAAHFTGEPECIAEARSLAAEFLQQLRTCWSAAVGPRVEGAILLVVSELVTNAHQHSDGPYVLELEGTDDALTVAVTDSSGTLPVSFPRDPERVGRHGLEIVRALARDIGVQRVPVGKCVRAVMSIGPD